MLLKLKYCHPDKKTSLEYKIKRILLNKSTKFKTVQIVISLPSSSLALPTSIITLLLIVLNFSTLTLSSTITTTSDVRMYLPFFIVDTPDTKESKLKLDQLTIQSMLSFTKAGDPKSRTNTKLLPGT